MQDDLAAVGGHGQLAVQDVEVLVVGPVDVRARTKGGRRDGELFDAEPAAGLLAGELEQMLDAGHGHQLAVSRAYDHGGNTLTGLRHLAPGARPAEDR